MLEGKLIDRHTAFNFWWSLKQCCVALFCFIKQTDKTSKTNKQNLQNITSCSCVSVEFSTVSLPLGWWMRAWGVVGVSYQRAAIAYVADLLLPQPQGDPGLNLLIKRWMKICSQTITQSWKKFLDWEWSDKRSEPSSSHKEKQLKAASQEELVKRTLNVMLMSVFLQCISYGKKFLKVLRHDNFGRTL